MTRLLLAGLAAAAVTGCGGTPPPPATDPDSLRQTEESVRKAQQAEAAAPVKRD